MATAKGSKSNNKVLVIVLVVVGLLVLLSIVGYFMATVFMKSWFESVTGVRVSTNLDGTTTIQSADGSSSVSTEQKLPADFPSNVPLYPGQKIVSSSRVKSDSGISWTVIAEVNDSTSKTAFNTKSQYANAGWESDSESEINGAYWQYYKNGQLEVNLYISDTEGKTNITYSVFQPAS